MLAFRRAKQADGGSRPQHNTAVMMVRRCGLLLRLWLLWPLLHASAEIVDDNTGGALATSLLEWLVSNGGFVSTKVALPTTTTFGLVAVEAIEKGERILSIPKTTIFELPLSKDDGNDRSDFCDYIEVLAFIFDREQTGKHMNKGALEKFWPVLQFLLEAGRATVHTQPFRWSREGQELVRSIVGGELEPQRFGYTLKMDCPHLQQEEDHRTLASAWHVLDSMARRDGRLIPIMDSDLIPHSRNDGPSCNVDFKRTSVFPVSGHDLEIVAASHIEAGALLYKSNRGCLQPRLRSDKASVSTSNLFAEHGILEPYPWLWSFNDIAFNDKSSRLAFALDEFSRVTWLNTDALSPMNHHLKWLHAHLKRLNGMKASIQTTAESLENPNEKNQIEAYFEALLKSFQQAIASIRRETDVAPYVFDQLEEKPDTLNYEFTIGGVCKDGETKIEVEDKTSSMYSDISFLHEHQLESGRRDRCLSMNGFLQSCTSFRAHYHEFLVHYSASFLPRVERVLVLGGGDLFIVHEILKYASLELLLVLELDQQVVRSSFRNTGTQPHFDDDRVQWWFGDAGALLSLIPETKFDLVYVDLESLVKDSVKVERWGVSIMEACMGMLKIDGVLARNDDTIVRSDTDDIALFANHVVELTILDVPIVFQQSITIGSNGINFLTATPIDHNIQSLYYKFGWNHFASNWTNYHVRTEDFPSKSSKRNEGRSNPNGVMMILEGEDLTLEVDGNHSLVLEKVTEAMSGVGLISVSGSQEPIGAISMSDGVSSNVFLLMKEGYIVARFWSNFRYCAFDILLWNHQEKLEKIKKSLISMFGGDITNGSTSSFRVLTGGMLEAGTKQQTSELPRNVTAPDMSTFPLDSESKNADYRNIFGVLMSEFLVQSDSNYVLVLSGEKPSTCSGLEDLEPKSRFFRLWTCPGLLQNQTLYQLKNFSLMECEFSLKEKLFDIVVKQGERFRGIILDPNIPKEMVQMTHKIFNSTTARMELLAEEFFVVAQTADPEGGKSWINAFLERVRTEMIRFNPVFLSHLKVGINTHTLSEYGILAAGFHDFYARLIRGTNKLAAKTTGLTAQVQNVRAGVAEHIPDFQPSFFFSPSDYDEDSACEQWRNQHLLGHQTLLQLRVEPPKPTLNPGDSVLVNTHVSSWAGEWRAGQVVGALSDGSSFKIKLENRQQVLLGRDRIRKVAETETKEFLRGDHVLFQYDDEATIWDHGVISKQLEGGVTYVVRRAGHNEEIIHRRNMIHKLEQAPGNSPTHSAITKDTLQNIVHGIGQEFHEKDPFLRSFDVGSGCVIYMVWSGLSVIAVWDGLSSAIDLALFGSCESQELCDIFDLSRKIESHFSTKIGNLVTSMHTMHPRGFGRIVNSKEELDMFWFGQGTE